MKFRWLVATLAYAAASVVAAWLPSDGGLLLGFLAGGDLVDAARLLWMLPVLAATAAVWGSARKGIRAAHGELSLALALAAIAYPFAALRVHGSPSAWVGSSAAAFVMVFASVLGSRALALQRVEPARHSPLY